jgi:hypothetical protein
MNDKALLGRLRRLCEKKVGTGKCRVGDEVHEHWMKSCPEETLKLARTLSAVNFDEDCCRV